MSVIVDCTLLFGNFIFTSLYLKVFPDRMMILEPGRAAYKYFCIINLNYIILPQHKDMVLGQPELRATGNRHRLFF